MAAGLIATYSASGSNFSIENSYNSGKISAASAGGIAGNINGSVSVTDSYNNGEIQNSSNSGKISSSLNIVRFAS